MVALREAKSGEEATKREQEMFGSDSLARSKERE
jgi:hypothetical protein